ncbi:complement factor H isoform X2 [Etheostoma spectabile]|uniref:complement factor H isoform X2 n=1 Tax=Etheostoma spectabile TaxID=54343 RepID=UPI0013AFDE7C|nr:complement factor H-like isoform X2 [Etheostoma spectabile]
MHVINQICVVLLWMHALTFAQVPDCTLEQFINGPQFNSNFDTTGLQPSYPAGKQIRVGCNVGYSGFFRLTCVEGGWVSKGTVCQPKSCGHPGDAQFADFNLEVGDDFVFGSKVVYTCHKGYQMVSRTNHRNCMNEGWDGVVPVCEAQQCPVIHVDSNVQVNGDPEEATYGNVVRFSCKSKSEILSNPRLAELYCDENGEWSGQPPKCIEIKCTAPQIENGYVTDRNIQEYKEHDVLLFECNDRYKRTEERAAKCTRVGMRAEWTPTPACEQITCNKKNLREADIVDNNKRKYRYNEKVDYRCKDGKRERFTLTCGEDGWIGSSPCTEITCNRKTLPDADIVDNDKPTYRHDEQVGYRCKDGKREQFTLTCGVNGWIGRSPCTEITCNRKTLREADIVDNNKRKYRYNEQVGYRCKDGNQERFTLTCGEDGWIGRSPCTESVGCGSPPPLTDGDIKYTLKSNYSHKERVEFMCQSYFTMEGEPNRTCINGKWIGQMRCLKPCIVNEDVYKEHNITLKSNDRTFFTHDEMIEFKCARGIPVGAVAMRQRCNGGEILLPTCQ